MGGLRELKLAHHRLRDFTQLRREKMFCEALSFTFKVPAWYPVPFLFLFLSSFLCATNLAAGTGGRVGTFPWDREWMKAEFQTI